MISMRRRNAPLAATVVMLLFMGAGCLDSDVSLILGFVNSWLSSRGIVDAKGNPTPKTIGYVASGGWVSTGDKGNDALIDGGLVVKSVKEADAAVDSAHNSAARGNFSEADASLNAQLAKRPNDHHVRNAKGAILLKQGRRDEAKKFLASTTACNPSSGSVQPSDYDRCKRMLRDEDDQLRTATPPFGSNRQAAAVDSPECDLIRQRVATLVNLEDIARLQSRFDEADEYRRKHINLEGSSPSCRRQ